MEIHCRGCATRELDWCIPFKRSNFAPVSGEISASTICATLLLREGVNAKVVSEMLLHSRTVALASAGADKIISKAIKRAKTGREGQLARKQPGLLVIGGFGLSDTELDLLDKAATAYLQKSTRIGRHSHIIAVSIMSIGAVLEATLEGPRTAGVSLGGTWSVRVVQNPAYSGDVSLSEHP